MAAEARLEDVGSGLAPVTPGWFVVNVAEAAWLRHDAFGSRCHFESTERVLAERPDLEPQHFDQLGYTLAVLEPGKPTGMYHAESTQEDFLVLMGECLLLIEEEERPLRAWDFVHCPPGTNHVIVGAGDSRCLVVAVGARDQSVGENWGGYTVDETAAKHGASVDEATTDVDEAYAKVAHRQPARCGEDWLPS